MKWKNEINIKQEKGYMLQLNEKTCQVKKEDEYLIKAIKQGMETNEELKTIIMKVKNVNETVAGFILAQFILDYQYYIEEDHSYFEITQ